MRNGIRFGICTLWLMAWITVIGCGGSGKSTSSASTYTIGGTVAGVTGKGLVLQNNGGGDLAVSAGTTSFTFATPVTAGGVFSVTVLAQPSGQRCTVANGNGTATANVANVSVTCAPLYTIGGAIQGLTGPGLVLQDNGGDDLAVSANATTFTFATPLAGGSAYSVTVLTQPTGENCAVTNGAGKASANVATASVVCTQLYAIGGTVTGLRSTGLELEDNGTEKLTVSAGATSFTFATPLAGGSAYSITVLTQPAGENCTVDGGTGTVSTDVVHANVICVGQWTWMAGSDTVGLNNGQPGVYGTLGTPSPTNIPGGRTNSASWKDASDNLWIFGGSGFDGSGVYGMLNDLWKFEPTKGTAGEWTWMSGSNISPLGLNSSYPHGKQGVYGRLQVASPANAPGARVQPVTWIDKSGSLWLFGGSGIDSVGAYGDLNDLWEFNPNLGGTGQWIWMGGSNTTPANLHFNGGNPGTYGTLGTPASGNIPGSRYGASAWTDASGNFWLFGGEGYDSAGDNVYLNDLWKYKPGDNGTAGQWTWMAGPNTIPPGPSPWTQGSDPGVYGTLGTPDPANIPAGRQSTSCWVDQSGNVWLFGGLSTSTNAYGYLDTAFLNDLWKYTPGENGSAGQWTWMGGKNPAGGNGNQPGVYGIFGLSASTNLPGARFLPASWVDSSGNLWLFGGQGYDWTGTASGLLNDLWEYTPGADGGMGEWTWMGGSNTIPPNPNSNVQAGQPGVYGTLGTPAAINTPGARLGAVPWVDASGNLWLLGGQGYDSTGVQGYLNDSWKYQP